MESIRKIIDTVTPGLDPPFADKNTIVGIRILRELVCLLAAYQGVRWTRQGSLGFGIPLTVLGGAGAIGEAIRIRGGFRQVEVRGDEFVQQPPSLVDVVAAVEGHEAFHQDLYIWGPEFNELSSYLLQVVMRTKGGQILLDSEAGPIYMLCNRHGRARGANGAYFRQEQYRGYLMVVLGGDAGRLPNEANKSGFRADVVGWYIDFYVDTVNSTIETPWNFANDGHDRGSFKDLEALIAEVSKLAGGDLRPIPFTVNGEGES